MSEEPEAAPATAAPHATVDSSEAAITSRALQLRRIAANLGGVATVNLLALLTGTILARALGPAGRGALAAAQLWPGLAMAFLSLGVTDAVTYYTSSGQVSPGAAVRSSRRLAYAQGLAILLLGFPMVYLAMHHFGSTALLSALIYLAVIPTNLVVLYLSAVLNGLHRYAVYNVLLIQAFALNALVLVLLWALGDLTVMSAILVLCFGILTGLALSMFVVRRIVGPDERQPGLERKLLDFGLRSQLSNFPHLLNDRVDQLVLSVVVAPRELGLYVIAVTVATAPAFVGAAVSTSVLPTLASIESVAARVAAARRAVVLSTVLTLTGSLVLSLVMRPLISTLFGKSFLGAVPSARILAFAAVMISLARVFHGLLKGIGRPLDAARSEGAALIVTGVGLAVSIPLLGILGAAITSLCAYSTSVAIGAYLAGKALGVNPIEFVWRR